MDISKISEIWHIILKLGPIAAFIALGYSISQNLRKTAKFSFNFEGSSRSPYERDGKPFCKLTIGGTLKNQCLENNCITEIHTIVWDKKKRHTTLRHWTHLTEIFNITDDVVVKLPLPLNGYQAKKIRVTIDMIAQGNSDEHILHAYDEIAPGFRIPKYEYQLMFEDVNGNIFGADWKLRNREVSDLWFTIGNTTHALKRGNPLPLIGHYLSIQWSRIKFRVKIIKQYLGLSK